MHRYVSTYCQHAECGRCRLTCKLCHAPCLCPCHRASGDPQQWSDSDWAGLRRELQELADQDRDPDGDAARAARRLWLLQQRFMARRGNGGEP